MLSRASKHLKVVIYAEYWKGRKAWRQGNISHTEKEDTLYSKEMFKNCKLDKNPQQSTVCDAGLQAM